MPHLLPLPLILGRSCSINPCATNGDFLQGMVSWWQHVEIASVFEFTVFAAWWERSLELKILSAHSMQDTACSEAQSDCWGAVCFYQPVSHHGLGLSCKSHCLSSCFCFLLCVCLCLASSSVLSGILSPQPLFLLLKYLLLSQSWISACTVSLKVSPWIMCMHWAWL